MPIRCAALAIAALLFTATAARADGTVLRAAGCGDHIFVSAQSGFSVLVADHAGVVKDGDELVGNVERYGSPTLFDRTSGRSVFVQVAELRLTAAEIATRVAVYCRAQANAGFVSGYVSRAAGCGSRIFVNTPQGYVVLERLAGAGVVADGDTLYGNYGRPGRTTVRDRQSGSDLVVFVEDLWLSKSAAERKMTTACRR